MGNRIARMLFMGAALFSLSGCYYYAYDADPNYDDVYYGHEGDGYYDSGGVYVDGHYNAYYGPYPYQRLSYYPAGWLSLIYYDHYYARPYHGGGYRYDRGHHHNRIRRGHHRGEHARNDHGDGRDNGDRPRNRPGARHNPRHLTPGRVRDDRPRMAPRGDTRPKHEAPRRKPRTYRQPAVRAPSTPIAKNQPSVRAQPKRSPKPTAARVAPVKDASAPPPARRSGERGERRRRQ